MEREGQTTHPVVLRRHGKGGTLHAVHKAPGNVSLRLYYNVDKTAIGGEVTYLDK